MYTDLRDAGFTYFSCACVTLFLALAVVEKALLQVFRVSHGHNLWGIIWVVLLFIAQTVGTATWFAYTPASFTADCEIDNSYDHSDFCAGTGARLALAVCVLALIAAAVGIALFGSMYQIPYRYLDRKVF